jgi:hypothetical protein
MYETGNLKVFYFQAFIVENSSNYVVCPVCIHVSNREMEKKQKTIFNANHLNNQYYKPWKINKNKEESYKLVK